MNGFIVVGPLLARELLRRPYCNHGRQAVLKMAAESGRALVDRATMEDKVGVIRPRLWCSTSPISHGKETR